MPGDRKVSARTGRLGLPDDRAQSDASRKCPSPRLLQSKGLAFLRAGRSTSACPKSPCDALGDRRYAHARAGFNAAPHSAACTRYIVKSRQRFGGVDGTGPATHLDGHSQNFNELLPACAMLASVRQMKDDAVLATLIYRNCDRHQFLKARWKRTVLGCLIHEAAEGAEHLGCRLGERRKTRVQSPSAPRLRGPPWLSPFAAVNVSIETCPDGYDRRSAHVQAPRCARTSSFTRLAFSICAIWPAPEMISVFAPSRAFA